MVWNQFISFTFIYGQNIFFSDPTLFLRNYFFNSISESICLLVENSEIEQEFQNYHYNYLFSNHVLPNIRCYVTYETITSIEIHQKIFSPRVTIGYIHGDFNTKNS